MPGPSLAEAVDTHGPLPEASLLALAEDGPLVIDFGISRAAESTMLTQAGMVVGSPGFISPEQATGYEVGTPSDISTLGAVLAFAATGEGSFGTGLRQLRIQSPPSHRRSPRRISSPHGTR